MEQERIPYTNEYVEELKKQLHNAVADYEQEKFNVEELKKQLEEYKQEKQEWINLLNMFKNQQKEFIKYLEEEISKWHYNYDSYTDEFELAEPLAEELLDDALSKYKEIIGDKDEKDNNNI